MSDDKKTARLDGKDGPNEKITVEMATNPVILGELRQLRKEGAARGERTDEALKSLAFQVQTNFEVQGGKIRAVEARAESLETRTNTLEQRATSLETEAKAIRSEIKSLGENKASISGIEDEVGRQISLTEEQMAIQLELEAAQRAEKDKQVDERIAPVETKVDMLTTMLAQNLGLRPPPVPNPDGSIPAPPKKKNAIEKQTFWTRIAAVMGGVVVTAGALDKMGAFEAIAKLFRK
jgi:hypothetical protein